MTSASTWEDMSALEGIRTPNLLIRSQMLYPLSYERRLKQYMAVGVLTVRVDRACTTTAAIERRSLILNGLKGAGHQRVRPPCADHLGRVPKPDKLDDPLLSSLPTLQLHDRASARHRWRVDRDLPCTRIAWR